MWVPLPLLVITGARKLAPAHEKNPFTWALGRVNLENFFSILLTKHLKENKVKL
jgi:hypothetical protein